MLKCLWKGNYPIPALCQETSKVQCMSLRFKNLKISSKKGHQWSESGKQSTNDVFEIKIQDRSAHPIRS